MGERYSLCVKSGFAAVFRNHLREIMKEEGYKERVMHDGVGVVCLYYFEKDGQVISLTIASGPVDESKVEIHSETVPVRELVLRAVISMVHELSDTFLKPVLPPESIEDKIEGVKRMIRDTMLTGE